MYICKPIEFSELFSGSKLQRFLVLSSKEKEGHHIILSSWFCGEKVLIFIVEKSKKIEGSGFFCFLCLRCREEEELDRYGEEFGLPCKDQGLMLYLLVLFIT